MGYALNYVIVYYVGEVAGIFVNKYLDFYDTAHSGSCIKIKIYLHFCFKTYLWSLKRHDEDL